MKIAFQGFTLSTYQWSQRIGMSEALIKSASREAGRSSAR